MKQIGKKELTEKLVKFLELGLTNAEIAERLNNEFEADRTNKMSTAQVAKMKAALGLKGTKPKKKALFEIIDEDPQEGVSQEVVAPETEFHGVNVEFEDVPNTPYRWAIQPEEDPIENALNTDFEQEEANVTMEVANNNEVF
jgi:hypothetical protein